MRACAAWGAVALLVLVSFGCGKERDQDLSGNHSHIPVLTTFSAVHSWTAALLEGVDKPVLIDPPVLLPGYTLMPTQERTLRSSPLLVAWGGELDEPAVAAYRRLAGSEGHVIFASPNDADDYFDWLNPERAIDSVRQLAQALRSRYPAEAGLISLNKQKLVADIQAADARAFAMMGSVTGEEVFIDDDRLLPFIEHYGLKAAGVLTYTPSRPLTMEEVIPFHRKLDGFANGVMLITNQQATAVLGNRTHIRLVFVDPMIVGYVGPSHYQNQIERNALIVTATLASRPSRK